MAEHKKDSSGHFYTHKPANDPAHSGKDFVSYGDKSGHTTFVYNPVEGVGPVVNQTGSHQSGGAPTVIPSDKG